ncbi:hypothetical protein ACTVP3_23235 [Serratia marcescens]|uniref:hypothetical protein n=1 Tax=Serratia marcescens TaxID=615 RepID=UPI0018D8AD7A|nr:hypothetical protein [Serratia marcescens]ELI8845515.1 hypothetical protein [Serratia marcescens]MBH3249852.1 hypothetical protein [Serratia marcescens]
MLKAIAGIIKYTWLYLAIFLISLLLIYISRVNYVYNDFANYCTLLVSVSGMVFTIMGIWLAFLYPNALQRIVNPETIKTADFTEHLEDTRRLEAIVGSVLKSSFVMITLLIIYLVKLILFKSHFYLEIQDIIKSTSLAIIIAVSYMQVEAVISVILANVMFINDLHNKREQRDIDEQV